MSRFQWRPYIPVDVRRMRALKKMDKLRKKGLQIQPVEISGRSIARTFWGEAWCDHLEKFSDFANRLPRGRTYVRNGSVCHLEIAEGEVKAMVSGSELYHVHVTIKTLPKKKWSAIKERCTGQIGSLLELLQGRLSKSVMAVVTDRDMGLFPLPVEISLKCDCPDWAVMCKHVAAVLYGVGARLDEKPDLLFLLRGVNHEELIGAEVGVMASATAGKAGRRKRIADGDLAEVFGIEMADTETPVRGKSVRRRKQAVSVKAESAAKRKVTRRRQDLEPNRAIKKRVSAVTTSVRPTGKAAARLRAQFGMSQSQFARLLKVSVPTVSNWENTGGPLNLRERTLKAWNSVATLDRREVWKRIAGKDKRDKGLGL